MGDKGIGFTCPNMPVLCSRCQNRCLRLMYSTCPSSIAGSNYGDAFLSYRRNVVTSYACVWLQCNSYTLCGCNVVTVTLSVVAVS